MRLLQLKPLLVSGAILEVVLELRKPISDGWILINSHSTFGDVDDPLASALSSPRMNFVPKNDRSQQISVLGVCQNQFIFGGCIDNEGFVIAGLYPGIWATINLFQCGPSRYNLRPQSAQGIAFQFP